jgi:hypothetical protein
MVPLYQDSDQIIEQQDLITKRPDQQEATHIMGQISFRDLKAFCDELDVALRLENPLIQNLFAKNILSLSQLIRVVNYQTRSGFKGSIGSGNQLDAIMFRSEQFGDPDQANSATLRTSWVRAVAAASTLQFIIAQDALGANLHGALTMNGVPAGSLNEAIAILGFSNPAGAPVTSAVQVTYLGVTYNIQNLDFQKATNIFGDPVMELKQPLFVYPGENTSISVRYYTNGSDELQPIGLWVKTSGNLRALATS